MTRTSTMQLFSHYILLLNVIAVVQASVSSFTIKTGDIPILGGKIDLLCTVTEFKAQTGNAQIYKAGIQPELSTCSATMCIPKEKNGYKFSSSGNVITVTIPSLSSTDNNIRWTCKQEADGKYLDLQVYSIPTSLILDGPTAACDLGTSDCTFTCKTNSCTYPSPAFTWLYSEDNGKTTTVFSNIGNILPSSTANECTSSAQKFIQTLSLTQYTTFYNNARKTIQIQCKIHFTAFLTISRHSSLSSDVIFAVKVSTVTIYDRQHALTSHAIVNVNEFEQKTLSCTAGYGHPMPTVQWYIGATYKSTGSTFTFSPSSSLHGQPIYCVADTIPDDKNDATSNKPTLYIKVKIKYVYIEPAGDSVLSVIEDEPEPVICATSGGRPGSTIRWFKLTSGQKNDLGEGDSLDYSSTGYLLNVTKSTKRVQLSRLDSGWKVSCSASNLDGAAPIEANNSKTFSVLYPPEKMSIYYSGIVVTSARIDVLKGTTVELRCSAVSKPDVDEFKWNVSNRKNETLTLSNIERSQIVNCTARNTMVSTSGNTLAGYSSISKEVNVLYPPSITSFKVHVNGNPNTAVTVTVGEHDELLFSCNVDSNPASTIEIIYNENTLAKKENAKYSSFLKNYATCTDTGQYSCKAWNQVDEQSIAQIYLQLNVRCSPRLTNETDQHVVAKTGGQAVLSLTVLAYPAPITYTWFRKVSVEWKQILNSSDKLITRTSLQYDLTVQNVQAEDYGEYKFEMDNGEGETFTFIFNLAAPVNPVPPKDLKITQENDDQLSVSWIAGSDGGSSQLFYIQMRDATTSKWVNTSTGIEDNGLNIIHSKTLPRLVSSPLFVRMYSESKYGQSDYSSELYVPGQQDKDSDKDGLLISVVVLAILLAISLLMNMGLLLRTGFFQRACRGLRRLNKENTILKNDAEGTQMSTLEESSKADNSEDRNVSSEHVYDEMKQRTTTEHAYGSLEQDQESSGADEKSYENYF